MVLLIIIIIILVNNTMIITVIITVILIVTVTVIVIVLNKTKYVLSVQMHEMSLSRCAGLTWLLPGVLLEPTG